MLLTPLFNTDSFLGYYSLCYCRRTAARRSCAGAAPCTCAACSLGRSVVGSSKALALTLALALALALALTLALAPALALTLPLNLTLDPGPSPDPGPN